MANIGEIMSSCCDRSSDEYRQGWQDAVCYINDRHKITDRITGEAMDFVFEVKINEDELVQKLIDKLGQ